MKKLEEFLEWGGTKKDIICLLISGIALLFSIFDFVPLPFDTAWIAIILCGVPIILEAIIGMVTAFDIKADVLVSIALIASVIIGEDFAAGEVAFIMQLGALLEDLTVAKARAGIEKLVRLTPQTARVIRDGKELVIPAEQVRVGDLLRVLPGETIPVDGIIKMGQTSVNQAVMTGESLPVDKGAGDEVSSGTVNQFGSFDMIATKVGEDSSIQRMIRLVQSADAGKAKIVGIADRWATWIVVIALSAAVLTWLVTGQIIRSVTILVVFCPCALVLATPTAIMAAIGNATKHGFLVREGDALERLAAVEKITFDKTGTLTFGMPEVVAVHSFVEDGSEEQILFYVAIAEQRSEHPLGQAVMRYWRQVGNGCKGGNSRGIGEDCEVENSGVAGEACEVWNSRRVGVACEVGNSRGAGKDCEVGNKHEDKNQEIPEAEEFQMVPGRGVRAVFDGKEILAGNREMLEEGKVICEPADWKRAEKYIEEGCTVIYLAVDKVLIGFIALADTLRPDAKSTIDRVKRTGIVPVLLTGDNPKAAKHIAGQLGITEIRAECLPEDKLNYIDESQSKKEPVCMIGDGVNDAPALKKAYVGIAMGGVGSDIAVDAADIVLVNDDIRELPHLLCLAKRMMVTIKRNLTFSMTLNFLAIILAITGILNPVVGALVHNAGSILVIINSFFVLHYKLK